MKKYSLSSLCAVALLAGCAAYSPIPEGYTGPTATIRDSMRPLNRGANFFYLAKVDGNTIENSLGRTRAASSGQGFNMMYRIIERKVQAKPLVLTLVGRTAYAAPIMEIAMAAKMYSVDATIEFTPAPDRVYVVMGVLEEGKAEIWLQDRESGERVGKTVEPK